MTSEAHPIAEIAGRRFTFEPHRCFACGELNEHGLHLVLHADATECWTDVTLGGAFQGWEDVVHGGILCTILDEVMAWSVIGRDTWGVTARMAVEFKRPVRVGQPIHARARVVSSSRRLFQTEGRIEDAASGEALASSTGTYVGVPPARMAELKARYRLRSVDDRGGLIRGLPSPASDPRASAIGTDAPGPVDG